MRRVGHYLITVPIQVQPLGGGGEDIIPFTLYQAKCWAMEHMDGDAYEAEFGEVEE